MWYGFVMFGMAPIFMTTRICNLRTIYVKRIFVKVPPFKFDLFHIWQLDRYSEFPWFS